MTRRSPQVRRVPGGRFRPSLGYEPYDVRLPCPGQSPAAALASADLRHEVVPGHLRLSRFSMSRSVSCTNACTNQPPRAFRHVSLTRQRPRVGVAGVLCRFPRPDRVDPYSGGYPGPVGYLQASGVRVPQEDGSGVSPGGFREARTHVVRGGNSAGGTALWNGVRGGTPG